MTANEDRTNTGVRAIVFDLYGTLLRIARPTIHKRLPRLLGIPVKPWMRLVRGRLMATPFEDSSAFVGFIRDEAGSGCSPEAEATAVALVDREVQSVEPIEGVRSTLTFLKRRGFVLGLASNLTSIHKEPIERFGLDEYFTAMALSCDEGALKPEPRIYLDLCDRLGVAPEAVLVVGDSAPNDVVAPRKLGMRALLIDERKDDAIRGVSELGWLDLEDGTKRFVPEGTSIRIGGRKGSLRGSHPVPDSVQGRLNLVARARFHMENAPDDKATHPDPVVFCKRYLFPEAAYVEEFMHELLARLGFSHCGVAVHPGPEPVLVASEAPGKKFAGPVDVPLAHEVGRHCAVSYLFANADWRPRNAFVTHEGGRPVVTVVDLEHCLFNLALDVSGLSHPERPQTIDSLSDEEVARRLKRRVLSERTTRRAMGTFVKLDDFESEVARSFRSGWVSAYKSIQSEADRLCGWIEQRVYTEPFLVIGTKAYRRAMARLDVNDIRSRMEQDPEVLFPKLAAVRSRGNPRG